MAALMLVILLMQVAFQLINTIGASPINDFVSPFPTPAFSDRTNPSLLHSYGKYTHPYQEARWGKRHTGRERYGVMS